MVAITNYSALSAINTVNNSKAASMESVTRLATGKIADYGQKAQFEDLNKSFQQGAKNLAIHAGRYQVFVGTANAITALTQQKLELATKYSNHGFSTHEYASAGQTYTSLDNAITQLLASPALGVNAAFNAAKTEGFAGGRAVVAGPTTRAWQRAANSGTVTGFATAVTATDVNERTEFAALLAPLQLELDNAISSTAALSSISKSADVASFAASQEAAAFSAAASAVSTDFAAESAKLAASQVMHQAATAMVAQAGSADQIMLTLLN
jgi:flagellin